MKKTLIILLLVVVLFAVGLRLYPTLISGMPFSTDAWPLIRNTQLLIQHTPVPLTSSIFDGYDNYWALTSVFGAVISQTTALPPITAMALVVPAVAALTILIFYVLVKKLTQNSKISLIAAALLAAAFPYALFTAAVTKETFASPIYIALILIFLLKHNWKNTLLFSVMSVALVFSHHLTAFFAVGILASISIASFISKPKEQQETNSTASNILYVAILTTITALYFALYALSALNVTVTASDIITVGAYQISAVAAAIYILRLANKKSPRRAIIDCTAILVVILILAAVASQTSILPGVPEIPIYYLLFVLPFIIAIPLIFLGISNLHWKRFPLLAPLFWLLPVLAFAGYGIFANPPAGVTFAVRSINFLLPPLTILIAIGIYKLYQTPKRPKTRTLTKIAAIAIILSMAIININSVYATVSLQEPYIGYFWRYEPSEFKAAGWLAANNNNQTIAGDNKAHYLIEGYFDQNVSVTAGLNYLDGDGAPPQVLYIYNQMKANGYVLYQGIPITLPQNWTDKLAPYNLIYQNSEVSIYAKR